MGLMIKGTIPRLPCHFPYDNGELKVHPAEFPSIHPGHIHETDLHRGLLVKYTTKPKHQ